MKPAPCLRAAEDVMHQNRSHSSTLFHAPEEDCDSEGLRSYTAAYHQRASGSLLVHIYRQLELKDLDKYPEWRLSQENLCNLNTDCVIFKSKERFSDSQQNFNKRHKTEITIQESRELCWKLPITV